MSSFNRDGRIQPHVPHPQLCPAAYLGAAATLLMAIECEQNNLLRDDATLELGPLDDLRPYIARRWGTNLGQELPHLPLSDVTRQTFCDWAHNEVDFVD